MKVSFDFPVPYLLDVVAEPVDIDLLGHVNNAVYVRWLTDCAWAHSDALGMDIGVYHSLDRAMAMSRHEIDYLAPAREGDALQVATWVREFDGRLTMARRFQIVRPADGVTLLRARTVFACIELSGGRPRRMPAEFITAYGRAFRDQGGSA